METQKLSRVFNYAGMELPDPDPSQAPDQAAQAFVAIYPELNNCDVQGPEVAGNKMVYTLVRAVGRKGAAEQQPVEQSHNQPLSKDLVVSQVERFFSAGDKFDRAANLTQEESPAELPPVPIL